MVHRNFRWEVGQIQKDPKGRFIFIQACIDSLPYVLLGIYLPPPSNLSILQHAARFANQFQQATLICIGDFNMLKDPVLDSFSGAHEPVAQSTSTALSQFLAEMGWYYLWRLRFPNSATYSCHSGRNALSRIDYMCGDARAYMEVGRYSIYREQSQTTRPFWSNITYPNPENNAPT